MKRMIIFRKENYDKDSATGRYLIESLRKYGHNTIIDAFYEDAIFNFTNTKPQLYLVNTESNRIEAIKSDLVYLRGYSHTDTRHCIAHYCADNNIAVLNTENIFTSPTSKLAQYYTFCKNGINIPNTTIAYAKNIIKAVNKFSIEYPFVIKSVEARGGKDNYLVKTAGELEKVASVLANDVAYAIQPYVDNDGDYRVIVFGNEVLLTYMRKAVEGSHLNNVGQGGKRVIQGSNQEIEALALHASKVLRREITGVDVIRDKHQGCFYVLEANFNFGIKQQDDGVDEIIAKKVSEAFDKLLS